jgi:hypothetical protein
LDRPSSRITQSGIALLEALVAIALMAIGVAGLAAWQFHLRLATDEVRHQYESLQLARQELERLRSPQADLSSLPLRWEGPSAIIELHAKSQPLMSILPSTAAGGGGGGGSHGPAPVDSALADPLPVRAVRIDAQWRDRAGQAQNLSLETLILDHDPGLTLWLLRADG